MAGKFSKTTTPGRGYTDAVSQSRGSTFSEEREAHFVGSADDNTITGRKAPSMAAGPASESADADTESDEAPSGRVQGG